MLQKRGGDDDAEPASVEIIANINSEDNNISTINTNNQKQRPMAIRENFISDAPDEESGAKVNLIDNNKTLYIDQFTSDVPSEGWTFEQDITSLDDAFKCFQPSVDVEFTDSEGNTVNETLKFNEIRDFEAQGGKGRLVENSQYLSGVKKELDASTKMLKTLKQNRKLNDILKNAEARAELKAMLNSLLSELED